MLKTFRNMLLVLMIPCFAVAEPPTSTQTDAAIGVSMTGDIDCLTTDTQFLLTVAGDESFQYWFKDLSALDVVEGWKAKYETALAAGAKSLGGYETFIDSLDQLKSSIEARESATGAKLTFKGMVLNQDTNGLAAEMLLVQKHLNLGFLKLSSAGIEQLRLLLEKEGATNPVAANSTTGVGDLTLRQYYLGQLEEKLLDAGTPGVYLHKHNVLIRSHAARQSTNIGDLLTICNLHNIFWVRHPSSGFCGDIAAPTTATAAAGENETAPAEMLSQQKSSIVLAEESNSCCCNVPDHDLPTDYYRKCRYSSYANHVCTGGCVGRCCPYTITYCPPHDEGGPI